MVGSHIILDLYGVDSNIMININKDEDSKNNWNNDLFKCFTEANVHCLNVSWNNFTNEGAFTALYLLSESHLSIHTWPENNYIAIDIFTCGNSKIDIISNFIINKFKPTSNTLKKIYRGTDVNLNNKLLEINNINNKDLLLYY